VSNDLINNLASSMRERRSAERNEIVTHLRAYVESISEYEREIVEARKMCDDLLLNFVVDRLAKGDRDGLKVFRNMLPPSLHPSFDRILAMYEVMYGRPPNY
jgi:hypothetical protein